MPSGEGGGEDVTPLYGPYGDVPLDKVHGFEQNGVHFVLCLRQGNKVDVVVLNRLRILVFLS